MKKIIALVFIVMPFFSMAQISQGESDFRKEMAQKQAEMNERMAQSGLLLKQAGILQRKAFNQRIASIFLITAGSAIILAGSSSSTNRVAGSFISISALGFPVASWVNDWRSHEKTRLSGMYLRGELIPSE